MAWCRNIRYERQEIDKESEIVLTTLEGNRKRKLYSHSIDSLHLFDCELENEWFVDNGLIFLGWKLKACEMLPLSG